MKTLSRSSSPRWVWFTKALAACAVTASVLHAPNAIAGGGQACFASGIQSEGPWTIVTSLGGIANGVTVAETTFSQSVTATSTLQNYAMLVTVVRPTQLGAYQTIPLATFPGLGLRWSYAGYDDVSNAAVNTSLLPPIGKVVTTSTSNFLNTTFTTNVSTKQYKHKWKFELVVTDVRAYAGGTGDFTRETILNGIQIMPTVRDNTASPTNQSCTPVLSGFAQALGVGGSISLPELPKPPTPTCQFPIGDLNQTVGLNFSTTGNVPANGAARTAGATSETRFNINAVNCGANSNYAIYFTDTAAAGAIKDYLNSSSGSLSGQVNLRLYQGSNSTPVQYGPPPTGSGLPANPPAVSNSNTMAGSNFVHDFYAQYVRAPGVTGTLPSGTLGAQATVTVVYP